MHFDTTVWGGAAAKYLNKIKVQHNLIVKIMTKVSIYQTKILPIYNELNFSNLRNIYKLEVLKFAYHSKKVRYLTVPVITTSL